MALARIDVINERDAGLLETLAKEKPWCDQPWARMALAIGARAIRRGRLLTDKEKLLNLAASMESEDVDPEMREVAAKIRAAANL
jgi:predicted nucleic acid-binding protein